MSDLNKATEDRLESVEASVISAAAAASSAAANASAATGFADTANNNALAALNNLSSGATAPPFPTEGNLWVDTSVAGAPVLKIRIGSAWQTFTSS